MGVCTRLHQQSGRCGAEAPRARRGEEAASPSSSREPPCCAETLAPGKGPVRGSHSRPQLGAMHVVPGLREGGADTSLTQTAGLGANRDMPLLGATAAQSDSVTGTSSWLQVTGTLDVQITETPVMVADVMNAAPCQALAEGLTAPLSNLWGGFCYHPPFTGESRVWKGKQFAQRHLDCDAGRACTEVGLTPESVL